MSDMPAVDVGRLIDDSPFSLFQMLVLGVCFLVSAIEGFDIQAIAFAAPALARQWTLSPAVFGSIFSIGLLGAVVGSMMTGVIQDKTGRKPALIGTILAFSLLTWLTAFAGDFKQLIVFRFLAGIGLGAAVPIYMSYASEFSPARLRTTAVAMTVAAFPIGAVLGGIAASALIGRFGWQVVFWVGGVGPLFLIPLVAGFMPESVRFLAIRSDTREQVAAIMRRINPALEFAPDTDFGLNEMKVSDKFPALFMKQLLPGTILLPLALLSSLLLTYCLLNWLPILLSQFGFTVAQAVWGTVAYNLSSVVGSLCLTLLIDRIGRPLLVLGLAYIVGCLGVATIGFVSHTFPTMIMTIFMAGFFAAGPQLSLSAFMANFYPTAVRGTGIGWGQGMGRIGSLAGPLVGGYLIALHTSTPRLMQVVSLAALVSAACLLVLMVFFKTAARAATGGPRVRAEEALRLGDDSLSHMGGA